MWEDQDIAIAAAIPIIIMVIMVEDQGLAFLTGPVDTMIVRGIIMIGETEPIFIILARDGMTVEGAITTMDMAEGNIVSIEA